jgi:UDP-GlcNAc:undecaprenyl-phosphate/decaprenyl-phosphate GlcNAc-1-phosphate transferase
MVLLLPILKVVGISFGLTAATMPVARWACFRWGITAPRTVGEKPERVPTLGGPPIIAGAFCALALTGGVPFWLWAPIALLCVAGVIDDIIVLTPRQKIACELVAAALLTLWGPRFVLGGWRLVGVAIAGFWLLAAANAFNLIDGLDGLAGGIGVISSATITAIALAHNEPQLALAAAAVAGALSAFLLFNRWPASIFMGDSGALPIGMLIGLMSQQAAQTDTGTPIARYVVPILIMLVPLLDTGVVTISRIATGERISRGGHDHSHHRLLRLGLSTQRAVTTCWSIALLFALCAYIASLASPMQVLAMLPFIVMSAGVLALFMANLTFDAIEPGKFSASMQGFAKLVLYSTYKWRLADMLLDGAIISAAYLGAYLIRLDFDIPDARFTTIVFGLWQVVPLGYLALFTSGVYRSIWRHFEISDTLRCAKAGVMAGALLSALRLLQRAPVSWSISILFGLLLFNLLAATRLSFVVFRRGVAHLARDARIVLIVGAGVTADAALQFLTSSSNGPARNVIGFLDDDYFKHGKVIRGVPVLGPVSAMEAIYLRVKYDELVLATDSLSQAQLVLLQAFARRTGVSISNFEMGAHPQLGVPAELAVAGS